MENFVESKVKYYPNIFPVVFNKAKGSYIYDTSGKEYIDFFSGAGALNYGHNNLVIVNKVMEYLDKGGIMHSLDMDTEAKQEFIQAFNDIILKPRGLEYKYKYQLVGPTGASAVEASIALARRYYNGARNTIINFTNAYHGHTLGSVALTANRYYHNSGATNRNNVITLPYDKYISGVDSTQVLEKTLNDRGSGMDLPCAVILELVQGEGGVNVPSVSWVKRLESLCIRYNILLIVDEIQTGAGRTGKYFAFEHYHIEPDIVILSKSVCGGYPMSMVLLKPELDCWSSGQHSGTFRGNNLAFVAGKAILDFYWSSNNVSAFESAITANEVYIRHEILNRAPEYKIRGKGMLLGIPTFATDAFLIQQEAFKEGLILELSGADNNVLKIMPPLTIPQSALSAGLSIIIKCLNEARSPFYWSKD